ncbi:MAG: hypothetical protein HYV41_00080 [Candidatus Magasanikbacteria bacterium]|nr:hypothetical protein [Candidatus Magasanikbacteria bacterium]
MRTVLHILFISLLGFGIFTSNIFLKNILSFPFNTLNISFVFLILLLISTHSGKVVWLSFITHLLFDIYSASTFGIFLCAGTMTMLIEYWLYQDLFTNKSVWTLIAMTASGLVIFRILYTLGILFTEEILWADVLIFYLWEMIFSLILAIISYEVAKVFFNRA